MGCLDAIYLITVDPVLMNTDPLPAKYSTRRLIRNACVMTSAIGSSGKKWRSLIGAVLLCAGVPTATGGNAIATLTALDDSALLVVDHADSIVLQHRPDTALVPASTVKLVTAWLALDHWGESHRFATRFYWEAETGLLWVVGGGDPFLVSEELALMARALARVVPAQITGIGLDGSLFERDLTSPGAGQSANPYDAIPSAIAANFNTIHLTKVNGELASAEPQTPLTPLARHYENQLNVGSERINIGQQTETAERYFAELLAVFLTDEGVIVGPDLKFGTLPELLSDNPLWVHQQSRSLGEILQLMLKYSTNFIANQLMLTLVASELQRPAGFIEVEHFLSTILHKQFAWQQFKLVDGAGLSRDNRLSTMQLVELLKVFEPWRHLLPEVAPGVVAKTGTLTDVRTLAGFASVDGRWQRFAVMINESAPDKLTVQAAAELVTDAEIKTVVGQ